MNEADEGARTAQAFLRVLVDDDGLKAFENRCRQVLMSSGSTRSPTSGTLGGPDRDNPDRPPLGSGGRQESGVWRDPRPLVSPETEAGGPPPPALEAMAPAIAGAQISDCVAPSPQRLIRERSVRRRGGAHGRTRGADSAAGRGCADREALVLGRPPP